ncbi:MAG: PAS domain-containing protein [Opitutaceae bacterium]|nr:PAS domain-containing protein [Opitutaceae bacterium]
MKAPLPANEAARLAALRSHAILDTPAEAAFDDLALLAAHVCQTPVALVSLIDEDRQWFKARIGFTAPQTPRDIALCAHTLLDATGLLEVPDTTLDPRFADNPLVADPGFRFYAGVPLVTPEGCALGTVCVMDTAPRSLSPGQRDALRALGRRAVAQLELRRQARQLAANERTSATLLAHAEQARRALLGVLEDEQRAGRKLRESEERFRQLAENINEVFWVTDLAKQAMLYISPAYERIWGRTCASLYAEPRTWIDAIHPEDRDAVILAATEKQARGEYDEVYRIVRPDGAIRWIHDRAYPIADAAGRVYRIVGTAEDITRHRELESQLRQAQKMEALGTLAGGIAHDFNNILGGIIGYAELARLRVKGDRQTADHLTALLQGAHRAAALVRQILAFSRRQEQQRILVQLRHVVDEPLKLLRASLPSSIELVQSHDADLPAILADPTQIHQVVMNLGTNSWHAMRHGPGRLEVRIERRQVDAARAAAVANLRAGDYVCLSVRDTGHGMDHATLERIFEPFFTTKAPGEGTGLGLSAVLGIVQGHDGAIQVQSAPDTGTTVEIYFPVQAGSAAPDPAVGDTPRGAGEHILYVDDELPLLQLARSQLAELGYRATAVASPSAALAAVRRAPGDFALVVTDLTMPEMTGVDLARELRAIRPDLPIVLVTGYPGAVSTERTRELGLSELLLKPHTYHSLGSCLHRILHPARAS